MLTAVIRPRVADLINVAASDAAPLFPPTTQSVLDEQLDKLDSLRAETARLRRELEVGRGW